MLRKNIFKKLRIIFVLISLSTCLGLMSNTYSRYIADTTGNIDAQFARWQILVNTTDITSSSSSELSFTPVIEENENVAANTIAPSSKGYFDIDIDPTNVDVSFDYTINLSIENENLPDLLITTYAVVPNDYIEGDSLEFTTITNSTITDTLSYDNNTQDFAFEPFTIRVNFEWYEGVDEAMDDVADTTVGYAAATENTTFQINADITFEQVFE